MGYEPNLALTAVLMESRRHRDRDRARVRSADAQLDEMVSQHQASTGSRVMGAVGDLLHGLLPTPAGGQIFSSVGGASGPARGRHGPGVRSVRVGATSSFGAEGSGVPSRDQGFAGDRRPAPTEGELFLQVSPPREAAEPGATGGALTSAAGAADDDALAGGGGIAAENPRVATGAPTLEQGLAADEGALGDLAENEVPASLDESGGNLGVSRGTVEGFPRDSRLGDVLVNPFWSPERKAFERLHLGQSGFGDFARMGSGLGASPGEPEVEMDPIALFRMRCFREAEERFREGLLRMVQPPSTPRSFASVIEAQGSEQPPKPPPGPPPASPPKVSPNQDGTIPPPPPPLPPVPPMPSFGDDSRGSVGENPNESLRTCDLPKLSEATTALEFGDWLSVVDSHMGDLSYSSGLWWNMVKGAVEVCYQEWLQKSPVDRLRLKPKLEGPANMWPRTERRALSMLLQAVPEHVKEDVISARKLTPDQVLFRLYCLYQPGGASERTKLLQVIADCKSGDTVREVLGWVRNWRRYVGRAKELGITLPDALVLVGVLQQGSEVLSRRSPQVAYRLNMIRQQLNLDQRPNLSSVMTYAEHLQAEAEELTLVGVDETETEKPPRAGGRPSVKMLDGSGTGPGRGGKRFWKGKCSVRWSHPSGGRRYQWWPFECGSM